MSREDLPVLTIFLGILELNAFLILLTVMKFLRMILHPTVGLATYSLSTTSHPPCYEALRFLGLPPCIASDEPYWNQIGQLPNHAMAEASVYLCLFPCNEDAPFHRPLEHDNNECRKWKHCTRMKQNCASKEIF